MTDKFFVSDHILTVPRPSLTPKPQQRSLLVRKSLKMFAVRYTDGAATQTEHEEEQKRIFLYLRPTAVYYDNYNDNNAARRNYQDEKSIEIHLAHANNIITRLGDDNEENEPMFKLEEFVHEKPTFILVVKQDNIDDIMKFSDSPLTLTLYQIDESKLKKYSSSCSTDDVDKVDVQQEKGPALAVGHMDLLQLFSKKRTNATFDIFLYPTNPAFNTTTCKMKWDIYTLIPLLKNIKFSNAIFISFTSVFNIPNDLLTNDRHDITARLFFKSKQLNKKTGQYDKIFICQFTEFTKGLINQKLQCYKWEKLKHNFTSYSGLGISSSIRFHFNKIFAHILGTEYVNFDFKSIDFHRDYALICNSLHRFVLTDEMHLKLEQFLINNQQEILVEIFHQSEPTKILLEGSIDLSIFLFPEVKSVSFAVALKAPQHRRELQFQKNQLEKSNKKKTTAKLSYTNVSAKNNSAHVPSESQLSTSPTVITSQPKTTFAVIRMCLKESITNPAIDLDKVFNLDNIAREIYSTCWSTKQSSQPLLQTDAQKYEEAYQSFDDCITQLRNDVIKNNIRIIDQTMSMKNYFCTQSQILMDRILPLVAHDFNKRFPTKTNPQFTDLMTTVYKELVQRVYSIILDNNGDGDLCPTSSLTYTDTQLGIVHHMSIMKYLYEIHQDDLATYFMTKLEGQYGCNKMYRFYKFLYAVEKKHFELAQEYLDRPFRERVNDGEYFTDLIQIYINYMTDVTNLAERTDSEEKNTTTSSSSAIEDLITALFKFCTLKLPKFQTGWILLYCIYKKCQYPPGITFARYQFENLTETSFINLTFIPKSLWHIYNDYTPQYLETERAKCFWKAINLLVCLGLYQFAEWLYDEISNECLEVEDYIFKKSFQLHLGRLDNKISDSNVVMKKFSLNKLPNHAQLEAFLYLVQGNALWNEAPNSFKFAEEYGKIINMRLDDTASYQLGLLRYAYYMLQNKKYQDAIKGFDFASTKYTIISSLGKGIAYYHLNYFQESIKCFAEATNFDMYIPNVWAYLALNHLKLGDNYKALECWKYAKLKCENVIEKEILEELEKINYDDLFLYIDVPRSTSTTNLGGS